MHKKEQIVLAIKVTSLNIFHQFSSKQLFSSIINLTNQHLQTQNKSQNIINKLSSTSSIQNGNQQRLKEESVLILIYMAIKQIFDKPQINRYHQNRNFPKTCSRVSSLKNNLAKFSQQYLIIMDKNNQHQLPIRIEKLQLDVVTNHFCLLDMKFQDRVEFLRNDRPQKIEKTETLSLGEHLIELYHILSKFSKTQVILLPLVRFKQTLN